MLKKSVVDILVELGALTAADLKKYEKAAVAEDKSIASYLLEYQKISEKHLAQAYAQKFEVPFIEKITEKMADAEVLAGVPLHFLRQHNVMPIIYEGKCAIATANPRDYQPVDELKLLISDECAVVVAPRPSLVEGINRYYPLGGTKEMIAELEEEPSLEEGMEFGEIQEADILGMASEAPVIKLVNHILYQAVKRQASDIHIEPFEKEVRVRYRVDGVLYDIMSPPKRIQPALASRIKIMANVNIAEKRKPQDGRIQIKIADKAIDIRVSTLPIAYGERIVMRILDKTRSFNALTSLSLNERDYAVLAQAIHQPNGIILITGPTGSGKTSTLYSILYELNDPSVNIITVEDPVEYQMKGIGQVQVQDKVGLTFAAALRSILRQDPDIVMIGETRDQETAQIAIQASLTGHLVLSTLHTNSAPASITRLIDMGIEPFLISSSLSVVVAQRLVRRLCDKCKKAYQPEAELLERLGLTQSSDVTFYKAVGCDDCINTGYKGRLAIFEIMQMTGEVGKLTVERAETARITQQAQQDGMTKLVEDGVRKAKQGLTSLEEVLAVASV